MQGYVRPIALAVIQRERDGAILVFEGHDPHGAETFYRPLGGTIEFGERSEQTVRRELYEEAGLRLRDVRYLATIENIFTHHDQTGHEIVLLYRARLSDAAAYLYEQEEIQVVEDSGQQYTARWMPLSRFGPGGPPLYPTGLLELLCERP
jgi:ADP-ribose pyrophosphatase YjhB (NUDIX family)